MSSTPALTYVVMPLTISCMYSVRQKTPTQTFVHIFNYLPIFKISPLIHVHVYSALSKFATKRSSKIEPYRWGNWKRGTGKRRTIIQGVENAKPAVMERWSYKKSKEENALIVQWRTYCKKSTYGAKYEATSHVNRYQTGNVKGELN